jgi:radical SAM superfamily enzyme YgiQ (UPF0313 family)
VTLCALGEGEETAVDIAAWLVGRRSLADIPGIAYRVDGQPCRTPARSSRPRRRRDCASRLASLPLDNYLSQGFGHGVHRGRSIPMLATRGCPYSCTFCSSPEMWTTRYYARSPSSVVDEIADYVERYGISNVDFEDLTAFINRDWILAFCTELERRDLRISYQLPSGTRSEALDSEVLASLWRSGCRNLTYAPESGAPTTLKRIKKKVQPERVMQSMQIAKDLGVNIKANLMIGFPDETRRELLRTIGFGLRAAWIGVDDIPLFPFSPYPGSQLYNQLRATGRIPPPTDDYFARLGYMDVTRTASVSRYISTFELNLYLVLGMSAFYAISYARYPSRILRTLRNVSTNRSETVLEQRLVEFKRRRVSRTRSLAAWQPMHAAAGALDGHLPAPTLPSDR